MEKHIIDDFIKKSIEETSEYYNKDADSIKEKIWLQTQQPKRKGSQVFILRSLAAACAFLLLCTAALSILLFDTRKSIKNLSETNIILSENTVKNEVIDTIIIHVVDTIYKEKEVRIYQPIVSMVETIDTVYVQQQVYIEKEVEIAPYIVENIKMIDSTSLLNLPAYEKEILITNNTIKKQDKKRWIQFRFGKDKPLDSQNIEHNSKLAFTKEL